MEVDEGVGDGDEDDVEERGMLDEGIAEVDDTAADDDGITGAGTAEDAPAAGAALY